MDDSAAFLSALPDWAAGALHGGLFTTGPWFRHFSSTALWPGESPRFIDLLPSGGNPPVALALKELRSDVFPHCRMLESMANYYSCGFGPICNAAPTDSALYSLAASLAHAASRYDGVRITPIDRECYFSRACEAALKRERFWTLWSLAYRNWYATTAGLTYQDYLRTVPSSFPATSEKRRQAFLRKGRGGIAIVTATDGLDAHIASYLAVYHSSWKKPEPFPHFIPGLLRLAASRGWLRLGIAHVDGEPAAAQAWFVTEARALIYKVAYSEEYSRLSVGSILTCALLEHVIDRDRVAEVDFLSGDDAYKARWMFARRDRHTLLALNPSRPRGLLALARETASALRATWRAQARLNRVPKRGNINV